MGNSQQDTLLHTVQHMHERHIERKPDARRIDIFRDNIVMEIMLSDTKCTHAEADAMFSEPHKVAERLTNKAWKCIYNPHGAFVFTRY